MGSLRSTFQYFSLNTSLHGFRRLWRKNRWRKCWAMLITSAVIICIYQIVDKMGVLMKDPLTININLSYEDKMEFPVVTICNTLKVRVSHVTKGELLLKLANFLLPRESHILWYRNLSHDEIKSMQDYGEKITARDFYTKSAVPLEETVLWCKLPDGRPCTVGDFRVKFTDGGVCYQLVTKITTKEGGQDKSLKLLLNVAQYQRVPDTDPSGLKIIIHERSNDPMMSNGYEVMAGYRMNVVLRKTITKQHANCAPVDNSLRYFEHYSYLACRREWRLEEVMDYCKCKPYTLEAEVPNLPDCSLLRQMKCVDRQGGTYEEDESSVFVHNQVPPCIGECTIIDFDKELSYATFRDRSTLKNMIGQEKLAKIKQAYQDGRESASLINIIRKNDPLIEELQSIAEAYQNLVVDRKIVPPYGSIFDKLIDKHPCLKNYFTFQSSADDQSRSLLKSIFEQFNPQLLDKLIDTIRKLELQLQTLNIDHLIYLAENVSQAYYEACSSQTDILCGLSIIYDLIEVRKILSSKFNEIESIQKDYGDTFSRLVDAYRSQNDSKIKELLPDLENNTLFDDQSDATVMLTSYLNHVNICLKNLYLIYSRQMTNGQPSFKTKDSYKSFSTDLRLANFTIHFFCNKRNSVGSSQTTIDSKDPKHDLSMITHNRKALTEILIQELIQTNRSLNDLLKEARFNVTIVSFLDDLKTILEFSTSAKYDYGILHQSLYDMNVFSRMVKTYLNQTVNSRMMKKTFFEELMHLNPAHQQGIINYKNHLNTKFKLVRDFLTAFSQRLLEIYSGDGKEAEVLRYRLKNSYKSSLSSSSGFLMADDPLMLHLLNSVNESDISIGNFSSTFQRLQCLLELELVISDVENESGLDLLDETKKTVDRVLQSLKTQIDETEQMKGFFQENLGLVNIYFRDLGVKETAQERAYDFFSFLCDVGGSIGLWLGASMLSLVELLDLCLYPRLRRDYARILHGDLLRKLGAKGDEPIDSIVQANNHKSSNGPSFKTTLLNQDGRASAVYLSDDDDNVSQAHLLLPRKGSRYLRRLNPNDDYWEDPSYTNSVYYDALESLSQLRSNDSDTLYSVSDYRDDI